MPINNNRYVKNITPLREITPIKQIKEIQQTGAIQQIAPVSTIGKIQLFKPAYQSKQTETFLADYNNPTELNSFIDALTNKPAVAKEFGNGYATFSTTTGKLATAAAIGATVTGALAKLGWAFTGGAAASGVGNAGASEVGAAVSAALEGASKALWAASAALAVPSIPAAAKVTYDKGIAPIVAGKPNEAFLNLLMNLGETMDYAANPIKGLVLEGGEGFIKATGLSEEGRFNYDYDTGNTFVDMLLEVVSDPVNMTQIGGSIAKSLVTKASVKPAVQETMDILTDVLTKQGTNLSTETGKQLSKNITKQYKNIVSNIAKTLDDAKTQKRIADLAEALMDRTKGLTKEEALKQATQHIQKEVMDNAQKRIQDILVGTIKEHTINMSEEAINKTLRSARAVAGTKGFQISYTKQLMEKLTYDKMNIQVIRGLSQFVESADMLDKVALKGALLTSGFGLPIEAVKYAKKMHVHELINRIQLRHLSKAKLLNEHGINLVEYTKAKKAFEISNRYVTLLSGQVSERNMDTFYIAVKEQLNKDAIAIKEILDSNATPLIMNQALDKTFTDLYGLNFEQYITQIQKINETEKGFYDSFLNYASNVQQELAKYSVANIKGVKIPSVKNIAPIKQLPDATMHVMGVLQSISLSGKNSIKNLNKLYTVQLNKAYVTSMLLYDDAINAGIEALNDTEGMSALLSKIKNDPRLLNPEVSALLQPAIDTVQQGAKHYYNLKQLYDNIAKMLLPQEVPSKIKNYILDAIMGTTQGDPKVLLATFDTVTLPELCNSIALLMHNKGFTFKNHEVLRAQIGQVYKNFLQLEADLGVTNITTTFTNDFINSIDTIVNTFSDFKQEFQIIINANSAIKQSLANVKVQNELFFKNTILEKGDIFEKYTLGELSDAGLAIKQLATQEELLKVYPNAFTGALNSTTLASMRKISNAYVRYSNEYIKYFELRNTKLHKIMPDIKKTILEKVHAFVNDTLAGLPAEAQSSALYSHWAYAYLATDTKLAENDILNFTIISELLKDKQLPEEFLKEFKKDIYNACVKNDAFDVYKALINTDNVKCTTIYPWDLTSQSNAIRSINFNEDIQNAISEFDDFNDSIDVLTDSFEQLQKEVAQARQDHPMNVMLQRYINKVKPYNKFFRQFADYYDSLFDYKMADEKIELLYKQLNNYPKLSKYSNTVDTLQRYWHGEIKFKQPSKANSKAYNELYGRYHYYTRLETLSAVQQEEVKELVLQLNDLKQKGLQDEFCEFYYAIQDLNEDIERCINKQNAEAWDKLEFKKFNKKEYQARYPQFDIKEVYERFEWNNKTWQSTYDEYKAELKEQRKRLYNEIRAKTEAYNKHLIDEYNKVKLSWTAVTPWDPAYKQQALKKSLIQATYTNAQGTIMSILEQSPEEFVNTLATSFTFMTFTDDILNPRMQHMLTRFKNNLPDSVVYAYDANTGRHWFKLKKDQVVRVSNRQVYLNGNPVIAKRAKKQFNELELVQNLVTDKKIAKVTQLANDLEDTTQTLVGNSLGNSQGDLITKDIINNLLEVDAQGTPLNMPKEIYEQFAFDKKGRAFGDEFFETMPFNESILGTAASRRELGVYASDLLHNMRNTLTQTQSYIKPKTEYMHVIFDDMFSISGQHSLYAGFSDKQILTALHNNPNYRLIALTENKNGAVKLTEILPLSEKDIAYAKELHAIIAPMQIYKDMYKHINLRISGTNEMVKLWERIMYIYKFTYLLRPGAFIRNFIDTNFKSINEMGISNYIENKHEAKNILGDVKQMHKDLRDEVVRANLIYRDIDNMNDLLQARAYDGIIRERDVQAWFDSGLSKSGLTYKEYKTLCEDFLDTDLAGGITKYLNDPTAKDTWKSFTNITGKMVEWGNQTENSNRLAVYLYAKKMGMSYTDALETVSRIHFDYSFKTKTEQVLDSLFPFTTFSMRNASYWAEALTKHPWLARNYIHLMKPSWDFKDYTPQQLANNRRVQAQIKYGQLKLAEFGEKELLFKLNPSIQDAFQMFSDPLSNIYEKLAAPIAAPIQSVQQQSAKPLSNLVPIAAPYIQAAQQYVDSGAINTSVINYRKKSYNPSMWKNGNYKGVNDYKDSKVGYYNRPNYTKNISYDAYKTIGVHQARSHFYPIIDIAHDIKMKYSINVYNRIRNQVKTDVYQGVRYMIKLNTNRFR